MARIFYGARLSLRDTALRQGILSISFWDVSALLYREYNADTAAAGVSQRDSRPKRAAYRIAIAVPPYILYKYIYIDV